MKLFHSILALLVGSTLMVGCTTGGAPSPGDRADDDRSTPNPAARMPPPAALDRPGGGTPTHGEEPTSVRWVPTPGSSWQLQLTGPIDTSVDADIFDIDGFDVPASVVDELHARGRKVVCYFSAGTFEDWRPDAASFPAEVLGSPLAEWPGERWLDIRRTDVLEPIMAARMDMCRAKGFDAVDPDNVDGYTNASGFPLTAEDQLRFNTMIARMAHERGLSVGLKNDLDQVTQLVGEYDFAVNEECEQYDECSMLDPFVDAGKAVLHVEYDMDRSELCPSGPRTGFSTILKDLDLDARREIC